MAHIGSDTKRIACEEHGVLSAAVPWACHNSGFTKDFERTVGWLASSLSKFTVSEFMRIDWRTVGRRVSRILDDIEPDRERRLDGLVSIGIDETSHKKGHQRSPSLRTMTRTTSYSSIQW